ncbi:Kinesin-like protein KIF16B [Durusdinium trenchii]|uniref:Kinesin-like protein KIF16B n=1 Tax=Durusdinium trenchii TaxID=1381693 RepID=A0ABP0M7Z2_9DINO
MHRSWTILLLASSACAEFLSAGNATARNLAQCHDCGVCVCVPKGTCDYCNGMGGKAKVTKTYNVGGSAGSAGAWSGGGPELVNCGVCKYVPRSSCQYCSGQGGPASVDSVVAFGALAHWPSMLTLSAVALCLN